MKRKSPTNKMLGGRKFCIEHPIDEHLSRAIDPNTINSGTFVISSTFCDHSVRMRLTVYPDTGTYKGRL